MARQTGIFQIEGSLGNLCFYKTKNGYMVREKSSLSKARIKSDPAFKIVRENNAEFARTIHAAKLFREVFRPLLRRAGYNGFSGKLTSTMMKVIKADEVNPRGQRTVKDGEPLLLEGFEFNENAKLSNTLLANFSASIDRAKGAMIIDVPAFSAVNMITAPEGATHFRLFSGGAAIDFETNTYDLAKSESACLPISRKRTGPLQLIQKVKRRSSGTMFLLLGIEFLQLAKGMKDPLRIEGAGALAIVKVSH